jgi:hypothetical protein
MQLYITNTEPAIIAATEPQKGRRVPRAAFPFWAHAQPLDTTVRYQSRPA